MLVRRVITVFQALLPDQDGDRGLGRGPLGVERGILVDGAAGDLRAGQSGLPVLAGAMVPAVERIARAFGIGW